MFVVSAVERRGKWLRPISMKQFNSSFPLAVVLSTALFLVGCASSDFPATASSAASAISRASRDFQVTGRSGSSATSDYDYSVTAPTDPIPVPAPDTSAQDTMNQVNQEMATQQANDAAEQQFLDGMAAAQQTENNANNP